MCQEGAQHNANCILLNLVEQLFNRRQAQWLHTATAPSLQLLSFRLPTHSSNAVTQHPHTPTHTRSLHS